MKKTMRVLVMAGMGIVAGLAIGAGPAQASDAGVATTAKTTTTAKVQVQKNWGRDRIVGYYSNPRACEIAGRIGERFGRWDDYDCDFVRFGFRRGAWALSVEQDWNWGRPGHFRPGHHFGGPGFHNNHNNGPFVRR